MYIYFTEQKSVPFFFFFTYFGIYITSNLGFTIAIPEREREQGRFRGSGERAVSEHGGASREYEGVGA